MTSSRTAIEAEVRQFLVNAAAHAEDEVRRLPIQANLWLVVDSLRMLDLLEYVERRFSFRLEAIDLTPENLGTIERIVAMVDARQQSKPT